MFKSAGLAKMLAGRRKFFRGPHVRHLWLRGTFEFNKTPFDLTYASSSFQHFINNVLADTESYCFAFVDDIFIFSRDMTSHKHHLHDIANRLSAYGLTLNMAKCSLGLSEITVLGYKLSQNGIVPLEGKIIAMKDFHSIYSQGTTTIFGLSPLLAPFS